MNDREYGYSSSEEQTPHKSVLIAVTTYEDGVQYVSEPSSSPSASLSS